MFTPYHLLSNGGLHHHLSNILLLIVGVALLFRDIAINVTIWVFKNVVSCHNDFFYVPTTWEKDTDSYVLYRRQLYMPTSY